MPPEFPSEPEVDDVFTTQVEYGVILDTIGSTQVFDTVEEARAYANDWAYEGKPLQVVKITIEPID